MTSFLASLFLFLALSAGAVALFSSRRFAYAASEQRLRQLRRERADGGAAVGPSFRRSYSSIPTFRRLLTDSPWAASIEAQLQAANVQLRVGEYLLIRLFLAVLAFFIPALILRFGILGIVIGMAAGAIAYALPGVYLGVLRRRRATQVEKQLVELAPLLASSLRSGFGLQQGIELAAKQMEPPLSDELALLLNDVNLGATTEQALLDMGKRVRSLDIDMFITAVLVQRTTGGNLAEILDQSAEMLRERERIRGDLATLTASQRLAGTILSIYPMVVGLLLLAILPSLWSKMFTETPGQILLGVALGLQVIGFIAIRRLMNIEI